MQHENTKAVHPMISPAIVGVSPFETPDVGLVEALRKAGVLGILDLGRDSAQGRKALSALHKKRVRSFGVRIASLKSYTPMDLSDHVTTLILDAEDLLAQDNPQHTLSAWQQNERTIWIQVCSLREARSRAHVELFAKARWLDCQGSGKQWAGGIHFQFHPAPGTQAAENSLLGTGWYGPACGSCRGGWWRRRHRARFAVGSAARMPGE